MISRLIIAKTLAVTSVLFSGCVERQARENNIEEKPAAEENTEEKPTTRITTTSLSDLVCHNSIFDETKEHSDNPVWESSSFVLGDRINEASLGKSVIETDFSRLDSGRWFSTVEINVWATGTTVAYSIVQVDETGVEAVKGTVEPKVIIPVTGYSFNGGPNKNLSLNVSCTHQKILDGVE